MHICTVRDKAQISSSSSQFIIRRRDAQKTLIVKTTIVRSRSLTRFDATLSLSKVYFVRKDEEKLSPSMVLDSDIISSWTMHLRSCLTSVHVRDSLPTPSGGFRKYWAIVDEYFTGNRGNRLSRLTLCLHSHSCLSRLTPPLPVLIKQGNRVASIGNKCENRVRKRMIQWASSTLRGFSREENDVHILAMYKEWERWMSNTNLWFYWKRDLVRDYRNDAGDFGAHVLFQVISF